jgi:ABC-type uncharacterized transport system involved in gliding motility auxiliary subunit
MTNKKKQIETLLFSTIGVVAMLFLLVAVYVIAGTFKTRIDLTKEKLYTLSPGTRKILRKLDSPVEIRLYCTQGKEMPVEWKTYAQRVEDLLGEYKKASNGKIRIKKLDPQPDSVAEDSANLDGIQGRQINFGDKVYLGLSVSMLDSKVALPFLGAERENLLEYDVSRAISRVTQTKREVVGILSGLQVFGEFNPMMMRMGQMQRGEPWIFVGELKNDFEVKQLQMDLDKVDDDIKVVVVLYPKGISDKAQYALDQFVMRGGKLIAFLDPFSIADSRNSMNQQNPLQAAASSGASMDKLIKAWGLEFDINKVLADMNYVSKINRGGGRAESAPAVLSVTQEAMNTNDVATSQLDSLLIPFAGVFTGTPADGLKQEVLVKSSKNSQLVEKFMAEFSGEQVGKDFTASGKEYALALRLSGKFKTAFPEGKPKDAPKPDEKKDEEKKDETSTDAESLKESKGEPVVVLVGDSDLLYDQFAAQVQDFFGQRMIIPRGGNLILVQNMVEQLAGDDALVSVRSRATMNRPFTLVRKMEEEANARLRTKIKDLEKSLTDTQAKLDELQKTKETGQRFILSPEQQAEIRKFQEQQARVRVELKNERRNLRREVDALENRLKWLNIAGMPLVVTATGISLAMVKRKKTAAK